MKKQAILLFLMVGLTFPAAFAQDKCISSGKIVNSGNSTIYVCLLNSTTFPSAVGRENALPPPEYVQILKPVASGEVSFAFRDVPKADYVVHAFADDNNNGKHDRDAFGFPVEPIRSYKPSPVGTHLSWLEQKFTADKDITDIVIKLQE